MEKGVEPYDWSADAKLLRKTSDVSKEGDPVRSKNPSKLTRNSKTRTMPDLMIRRN